MRHHAFVSVCFRISKRSRSVAGQVGACTPRRRPWKRINTLYSDI